jgi:hypothetical protein
LESSISALESAISALESEIRTLENSSVPWEHRLPWFTGAVVIGVVLELWVIWHERRDDMESWALGHFGLQWWPARPSTEKFLVELVSVVLITGGIVGELWVGIEIATINGKLRGKSTELRSKGAELRSKSDRLIALLTGQVGDAATLARTAHNEADAVKKETDEENKALLRIKKLVEWRTLTQKQKQQIKDGVLPFARQEFSVATYTEDPECVNLLGEIFGVVTSAQWKFIPTGPGTLGFLLETGVTLRLSPSANEAAMKAAEKLKSLLNEKGIVTSLLRDAKAAPNSTIQIRVGKKP